MVLFTIKAKLGEVNPISEPGWVLVPACWWPPPFPSTPFVRTQITYFLGTESTEGTSLVDGLVLIHSNTCTLNNASLYTDFLPLASNYALLCFVTIMPLVSPLIFQKSGEKCTTPEQQIPTHPPLLLSFGVLCLHQTTLALLPPHPEKLQEERRPPLQ